MSNQYGSFSANADIAFLCRAVPRIKVQSLQNSFFFSCLVICIVNPCIVKVFHINASHCFSTEVGDRVLKWVIIHQTGPNIVSHTSDLKIWILEQLTGFFFLDSQENVLQNHPVSSGQHLRQTVVKDSVFQN